MTVDTAQWMGISLDHRKPAVRMSRALDAIDQGAPLELVESVYWPAARSRHRDVAKGAALAMKAVQARFDNASFACAVYDALSNESASGAMLPLLHQLFDSGRDPELGRRLARELALMGGHDAQAVAVLRTAHEAHPAHDDVRRDLAWMVYTEDPEGALTLLDGAMEPIPMDWELRRQVALQSGHGRDAHDHFNSFKHELNADDVLGYLNLADFHMDFGRFAQASACIREARLPARDHNVAAHWVVLMSRLGHGAEAARQIRARFKLKIPEGLGFQVFISLHAHDAELGLAGLERAFAATHQPEAVLELQFRHHVLTQEWDKAMAVARKLPLLWADLAEECTDPTFARVARLGMHKTFARGTRIIAIEHTTAMRAGKAGQALTLARELERDYPTSHVGPERLAWTLALTGEPEQAMAAGALAVERDPICPVSAWTHALALAMAGQWDDAVVEARRYSTIRSLGQTVTFADMVLEAHQGGLMLEELIAAHQAPKASSVNAPAYAALRTYAASRAQ